MSGLCSAHQGHDQNCEQCTAIPLTEEMQRYYDGWNDALEAQPRHGWHPVEQCVLDGYEALEAAARAEPCSQQVWDALEELERIRELKRGFAPPKEQHDVELGRRKR